ncbi:MAG: long-chain fatty aldehyde decarbonylase [Bacteroidetes bacterium]|nr:long-chain fatty aldehyde decarbonylase [Bacteroidota bacterium]MBS1631524.1 long-chain fatty aldehyde decarbonylase [Bacteroidota bacterium]
MNATTNQSITVEEFNVISDVFSQAITGELIGMSNFASLTDTIDDPYEKMEAVEHANSERMHAEGFAAYAKKQKLNVKINLNGEYWGNVRKQFLSYAQQKDFIACLIIQEVMLESFAISMYTDVGNALGGEASELFLSIADEEKEHLEHSTDILRKELQKDPVAFIKKFEEIHFNCMTILAQFSATTDLRGHCGVCNGDCMKGSLHHIALDIVTMRGNAMALYADALDNIGIPGEKSTVWLAQLPA